MVSATQLDFDVVVVGGGPAGLAAATTAAEHGQSVALVDDNPRLGGQIWRSGKAAPDSHIAKDWLERTARSKVRVLGGARVFSAGSRFVDAETDKGTLQIRFGKLVLATGARELFLPFPGWTLPNVMGAGGLQALAKGGLPVAGKRIVVAGTGPLLLAVAAYLSEHGAHVVCICEQASWSSLTWFAMRTLAFPAKAREALKLRHASRGAQYWTSSWPVKGLGKNRLEAVAISKQGRVQEIACDYLACGYHLVPNTELAQMLGCRVHEGFVSTDEFQQTSAAGVYCAGEPTGIGGMELALAEGRIAGHAAANAPDAARKFFGVRARYRKIAWAMASAFRLRPELAKLAQADTLLCRCEDVPFGHVQQYTAWKEAKLHSRCGMGPCQGRVCGAAAQFLFGWKVDWNRPPVFPVRCASLSEMR